MGLEFHFRKDLVLEVDISRSSMPKFGIYAALRVSEVWVYDGIEIPDLAAWTIVGNVMLNLDEMFMSR